MMSVLSNFALHFKIVTAMKTFFVLISNKLLARESTKPSKNNAS